MTITRFRYRTVDVPKGSEYDSHPGSRTGAEPKRRGFEIYFERTDVKRRAETLIDPNYIPPY